MNQDGKLVFSVNRIDGKKRLRVGGFADRLKGVVTCYLLAVCADCRFLIDWDDPSEIADVFAPNTVDWRIPGTLRKDLLIAPCIDVIDAPLNNETLRKLLALFTPDGPRSLFQSGHVTKVHSNSFDVSYFSAYRDRISEHLQIEDWSKEAIFSSSFRNLFRFELVEPLRQAHGEFQAFRDRYSHLFGAQFRSGGDGSWKDPRIDNPENIRLLSEAILRVAESRGVRDFGVYLTTDSDAAKDIFRDRLGASVPVFCFNEKVVHVERSDNPKKNLEYFVYLEHTCLSACDDIVLGKGGFGVTAAYRRGIRPSRYWDVLGMAEPDRPPVPEFRRFRLKDLLKGLWS